MNLSIVIVNWNTRDILRDCLMLIPAAAGRLSYEIVIVDNGSQDGSVDMIKNEFPDAHMLENQENLGFPKAVNQGIQASSGDYVALVNSDIMVPAEAFSKMVDYLRQNEMVAAVGPQLVARGGHFQYSGGFAPSPLTALHQLVGIQAFFGGGVRGIYVRSKKERPMPVDWLCAACIVVTRKAIDEVGLLDDSHFMYAEDVEFGLRLRRFGWELHLLPAIRVLHYHGASSTGISEIKLMGIGGIFRVAAGVLSRPSYTLFGVLLAASFYLRYFLVSVSSLAGKRNLEEIASGRDFRKYASTSWMLGFRGPKYASEFCAGLENAYHDATAHLKI